MDEQALAGMTEAQIRRAQDLVRAQKTMAAARANHRAFEQLTEWEDAYTREMLRRLGVESTGIGG